LRETLLEVVEPAPQDETPSAGVDELLFDLAYQLAGRSTEALVSVAPCREARLPRR